MLHHGTNLYQRIGGMSTLCLARYSTEVATLSIEDHPYDPMLPEMEPLLFQQYRKFGYHNGCGKIENSGWTVQELNIGNGHITFP